MCYVRSEVYSFCELSEAQQNYARREFDWDQNLEDSQFVTDPRNENEVLHLGNFVAGSGPWGHGSKYWDGIYGLSYDSAYYLKFSKCNTACVVAYRYQRS